MTVFSYLSNKSVWTLDSFSELTNLSIIHILLGGYRV